MLIAGPGMGNCTALHPSLILSLTQKSRSQFLETEVTESSCAAPLTGSYTQFPEKIVRQL